MKDRVDLTALEVNLRGHVEALARTPRLPGSQEHAWAATYIKATLENAGFSVQVSGFREVGLAGTNLLTQPLPEKSDRPLLIVGAHYDSVPGTPGADDNASGVAGLLELAREIGPLLTPTGGRLQLAAYDLEEFGYGGSMVHSRECQRLGIPLRGMISLEMLGYTNPQQRLPPSLVGRYPSVGNFIGLCGNERSRPLLEVAVPAMKTVTGLPVESIAVPGNGEILPEVRLSDHCPFWDRGYQALMITDTSFFRNPHYHQPSDTPDTLDYPFLARVTAGVCEAVRNLLLQEITGAGISNP